jgi:DNA-binding transcriptional LysR family regulator
VALYVLPPGLARFRREHPGMAVALGTGRALTLAAEVVTGRLDLALVNQPVQLDGLAAWCVYEERVLPVAAPFHPSACNSALTLAEFSAAGLIGYRASSTMRDLAMGVFHAGGISPRITLTAHNTEAARRMALSGAGVALVPELAVRDDIAHGRLVMLPLERVKLPVRGIWGLRREDERASAGAKALLDAIVSEGLPRGARARRGPVPPQRRRGPLGDGG